MTKPMTKPTTLAEAKTRLVSRCSGMTGSAARASTRMKPATQTTASTPSKMIGKEPQG